MQGVGDGTMWADISTYPLTGPVLEVEVEMADGSTVQPAHYAEGGGEDQPPFKGWFRRILSSGGSTLYFGAIDTPVRWRRLEKVDDGP